MSHARTARVPGVRIFEEEYKLLEEAAEAEGKRLNEWVRDTLLREAFISTARQTRTYKDIIWRYDGQLPPWTPKVFKVLSFPIPDRLKREWPKIKCSIHRRSQAVSTWYQKLVRRG